MDMFQLNEEDLKALGIDTDSAAGMAKGLEALMDAYYLQVNYFSACVIDDVFKNTPGFEAEQKQAEECLLSVFNPDGSPKSPDMDTEMSKKVVGLAESHGILLNMVKTHPLPFEVICIVTVDRQPRFIAQAEQEDYGFSPISGENRKFFADILNQGDQ